MKAFISSKLTEIEQSMADISQRVQNLEDNVGNLSKTVDGIMTDGSASSSSVASTPSNKRKRKSPLGLQGNVACFFYKLTADATVFFFPYRVKSELFTDLDDDSQLHLEEL